MNRTRLLFIIAGSIITVIVIILLILLEPIILWLFLVLFFIAAVSIGIIAFVKPAVLKDFAKRFKNSKAEVLCEQQLNSDNAVFVMHNEPSYIEKELCQKIDIIENRVSILLQEVQRLRSSLLMIKQGLDSCQDIIEKLNSRLLVEQKKEDKLDLGIEMPIYPITYYAQAVDSTHPLGFKIDSLTKVEDKSVFIITVKSELTASYCLIPDLQVQEAIISMFDPIITESSEYDNIPRNITQIITLQEGELILDSNVWKIVNKQKIKII